MPTWLLKIQASILIHDEDMRVENGLNCFEKRWYSRAGFLFDLAGALLLLFSDLLYVLLVAEFPVVCSWAYSQPVQYVVTSYIKQERKYLGRPCGLEDLLQLNDRLNAKVLERVSDSQELVTLSNFTFESDEYCVKKSLQERITEIASWHWVLSDLAKRLVEAMETLRYEHKALRVVVERLRLEINGVSKEGSRPGALCPLADCVEVAICQELEFLKDQKKMFETLIPELEDKIKKIEKTKNRIEHDIQMKEKAIAVDEKIAKLDLKSACTNKEKKKVKYTTIPHWQNRCASLKKDGLQALSNAIITRQQVRGTRIQLSVAAQAYASRVDAGLRRRLHANRTTAQELAWQIEEASRDYKALEEELTIADKRLIENLEKERLVEARLEDRTQRPPGEFTKDAVDRKMKEELVRLKRYTKDLRNNVERIMSLQRKLSDTMVSIDNCFKDVYHVIRLDEERIISRTGFEDPSGSDSAPTNVGSSWGFTQSSSAQQGRAPTTLQEPVIVARGKTNTPLETIQEDEEHDQDNDEEVDEDDDYPFND